MRVLTVSRVLTVGSVGLFAGILLGDLAGPAQARPVLDPSAFVQLQQIVHARYVIMMPALIAAALLAGFTWIFLIRSNRKTPEFWLVAGTIIATSFCLIITRLVNVPVNNQLVEWSIAFPPPNVHELWAPWEGAHAIRTVVALAGFVASVIALAVANPPAPVVAAGPVDDAPAPVPDETLTDRGLTAS